MFGVPTFDVFSYINHNGFKTSFIGQVFTITGFTGQGHGFFTFVFTRNGDGTCFVNRVHIFCFHTGLYRGRVGSLMGAMVGQGKVGVTQDRNSGFTHIGYSFNYIEVYPRGATHTRRGATRVPYTGGTGVGGTTFFGRVGRKRTHYAKKLAIVTRTLGRFQTRGVYQGVVDNVPVF